MEAARAIDMTPLFEAQPAPLLFLVDQERDLKRAYLAQRRDSAAGDRELLTRSVEFLELNLALFGVAEAAIAVGAQNIADVRVAASRIQALASGMTGLDVIAVFERHAEIFKSVPKHGRSVDRSLPDLVRPMVRMAGSIIESCPIEDLRRMSVRLGLPEWGHRGWITYERLAAFVRRNSSLADASLRTAGQAYAEGRLAIDEVAQLVGLPVTDAVVRLEELGFSRPIDAIRMSASDRRSRLERIAEERAQRNGKPAPRSGWIRREVAASQRIEDIDARPWLTPDPAE